MIRIVPQRFTVDFQEMEGSPTESMSGEFWQGTGAVRTIRCDSRDRVKLANEFLGYRTYYVIHQPHAYRDLTSLLVATSIETKPIGVMTNSPGPDANYAKTELVITYTIAPETFEAFGGLVTINESIREVSEFVTVPTKGLYWYVDGIHNEAIDEFDAPGKINKLLEWTYQIRHAYEVPTDAFLCYGKVNLYSVYSRSLGYWFQPQTLLCGAPDITKERTFNGNWYDITLKFSVKQNIGPGDTIVGWNHYPRSSDGDETDIVYERMVKAEDSPDNATGYKTFYPIVDFKNLYIP